MTHIYIVTALVSEKVVLEQIWNDRASIFELYQGWFIVWH
jgi:hypothetical protein